jgi:hypothetical protein
LKRHTRPYGCTWKDCHKIFGSKNDWKRHENTQHFHLDSWRCGLTTPNSSKHCAKVFFARDAFKAHLKGAPHKLPEKDLANEIINNHMPRNYQGSFWCGFCRAHVKLQKQGSKAWDERFDHISDHFKKTTIDHWYTADENNPKGYGGCSESPSNVDLPRRSQSHSTEEEDDDDDDAVEIPRPTSKWPEQEKRAPQKTQSQDHNQFKRIYHCVS